MLDCGSCCQLHGIPCSNATFPLALYHVPCHENEIVDEEHEILIMILFASTGVDSDLWSALMYVGKEVKRYVCEALYRGSAGSAH